MRWRRALGSVAVAVSATLASAQQDSTPDIVVVGIRPSADIVVHAPPHCRRRAGDPADEVTVHRGITEQRVIALRHGKLDWHRDDEPITGPDVWQRAGNAIGDYVFRAPVDGTPLCIGAAIRAPGGYGQLRQIVPSHGMAGRYVHFSAQVATRDVELVRFFLVAAGQSRTSYLGGDTHNYPLRGTHGWQQVDLLVGPVPVDATHVSYGLLLDGHGDVWLNEPQLRLLSRSEAEALKATPVEHLLPQGQ